MEAVHYIFRRYTLTVSQNITVNIMVVFYVRILQIKTRLLICRNMIVNGTLIGLLCMMMLLLQILMVFSTDLSVPVRIALRSLIISNIPELH